jgi:hypothetical protein
VLHLNRQMTRREPWKPRILRRFGRLLAAVLALFYVLTLIGEGVAEGFEVPDVETAAVVTVFSYAALSTVVAWLNDRVGGAMLVVAGVALVVLVATTAGRNHAIAATVIGGPFLLAGAALLWAVALEDQWRAARQGDS